MIDLIERIKVGELRSLLAPFESNNYNPIRSAIMENLLLHRVVRKESIEMLELLLKYSDEEVASCLDSAKNSALHIAVERKNLPVFKAFFSGFPSSIAIRGEAGNTPLHLIAKLGYVEACEIAVKCKNSKYLNAKNDKRETPLHIATLENHPEILDFLLSNGASFKQRSNSQETALHYACDSGYADCVRSIVRSIKNERDLEKHLNSLNHKKRTPLILAASKGHTNCCLELEKADHTKRDSSHKTALHYAAENGYLPLVTHLLDIGSDMNIYDIHGKTPLFYAAAADNDQMWKHMLQKMGPVEDSTIRKILEFVCAENYAEILKKLLQKSNFKNQINSTSDSKSFLLISLQKSNFRVSKLLLDHGADRHFRDKQSDEYPLHVAAKQKKLVSRYAEEERQAVCKIILKDSYNFVNAKNKNKESPLHLAAKSGNLKMVQSLLTKGAKLMEEDSNDYTAVHVAAENGRVDVMKRLLRDMDWTKMKSMSSMKPHPLHMAARKGHMKCCQLIVQKLKVTGCREADILLLFIIIHRVPSC